jgi:hypothetical protein
LVRSAEKRPTFLRFVFNYTTNSFHNSNLFSNSRPKKQSLESAIVLNALHLRPKMPTHYFMVGDLG